MSGRAALQQRVRRLRERAHADALRGMGQDLREWAERDGVPCWPPAEDERWQEWSARNAGPELRVILSAMHEATVELVTSGDMDTSDLDLTNPWTDDDDPALV